MFRPSILLVRHGLTDDNKNSVFQGQGGSHLNAEGREQATRLSERLAKADLVAAYSSDLDRARETAEIVASKHALEVTLEKDLREVDVGAWTGLSHDEIAKRYPEEWTAWTMGLDVRRGGGETYDELADRVMRVLTRISAGHEGVVLCVSHGGAIRSVLHRVFGAGFSSRALSAAQNCGITLLERSDENGAFRVGIYNDTNHLGDAVLARIPTR